MIRDNRDDLFEGSITYKVKGTDKYLTLIEALNPARYYRAWISGRLDGEWTPLEGASSWEKPFAGINNVTFEEGVSEWTRDISHGELLRDGYDENMVLDPSNLRFLFQGRDPSSGGNYSQLPYQLGFLRAVPQSAASGEMPLVYDTENTGADVDKPPLPSFDDLPSIPYLPDPFLMADGTRMTTRDQWHVRRAQIKADLELNDVGEKPESRAFSKPPMIISEG